MKSRIFLSRSGGVQESPLFRWTVGLLRIMYGILWLQQAKWKVPPDFGMKAGDGLWYWLNQAIQYPTWSVHHAFLTNVVLPHFILFGYLTPADGGIYRPQPHLRPLRPPGGNSRVLDGDQRDPQRPEGAA